MNLAVLAARILMVSPVLGFLPVLALRFATEKVPKPVRVVLPPFFRSFVIASVMEPMACAAAALVILASFATLEMSSALAQFVVFLL